MQIATAATTVKFHELPSGTVLYNYQPGTRGDGSVRSISWSKGGTWLAVVPFSGSAEIVSVKGQLKLIHTIHGIEEPSCAAFQNTTKKNIAVGTRNGQVLIYDIKARNVKKRYPRGTSLVTHVEFTIKDNHIVTAYSNGEAVVYSNVNNSLSGTFKVPKSQSISALRTNPIKRNYVAAGSNEGVVAVWDINSNKTKFAQVSHKATVTAVAFSPINCDFIASAGLDRQFCLYDLVEGKCLKNVTVENNVMSVDFSPDGKFIAMGTQKGNVNVYDSRNFQSPLHSFAAHNSAIKHLSFKKSEDLEASVYSEASDHPNDQSNSAKPNEQTSDSFKLNLIEPSVDNQNLQTSTTSSQAKGDSSADPGDSFMAAIGIDRNYTMESRFQESSVRVGESLWKIPSCKETTPNPTKILHDKLTNEGKRLTSTPNFFLSEAGTPMSPIVDLPQTPSLQFAANETLFRNIVKDELKNVTAELKKEMKYYSTHSLVETRQLFLENLMFMVKESLKMETILDDLKSDLTSDIPQSQELLLQENLILKQRLVEAEAELALLRSNIANTKNNP